MRNYPKTEEDLNEVKILNADQWQIDALKVNPNYVYWGCYEDYMSNEKGGWDSRVISPSIASLFELDELNELVNFYFEIHRENHECPHCEGSDLNTETLKISEDWYDFNNTGRKWCHKITEIEIKELVKHGRLRDLMEFPVHFDEDKGKWFKWENNEKIETYEPEYPSPYKVNSWSSVKGFGHDAINRWICVEARAKSLGVYGHCDKCEGGRVYDEPKGKLALQLWYLHPRKGCSRGVYIQNVLENQLPEVYSYLKEAANRNKDRFSLIP